MRTFEEVQDKWFDLLRQYGTSVIDHYDQGYEMAFLDALEWVLGDDE